MNRRAFLGRLAALAGAPLIIEPTLEDIDRFAWRRRLFPVWSPSRNVFITPEMLPRFALEELESTLRFARIVSKDYSAIFAAQAWAPRIGDTLHVRMPARYTL